MKLLGSTKSKRTKDGDGKNVPHLQASAPLNYCQNKTSCIKLLKEEVSGIYYIISAIQILNK